MALRSGDTAAIKAAAARLRAATGADRIALVRGGRALADVGDPRASFPATRTLVSDGRPVADLQVSVLDAQTYARLVQRVTHLETIVRLGNQVLASTIPSPRSLS